MGEPIGRTKRIRLVNVTAHHHRTDFRVAVLVIYPSAGRTSGPTTDITSFCGRFKSAGLATFRHLQPASALNDAGRAKIVTTTIDWLIITSIDIIAHQ